eukprot:14507981-Alexandrium_andersonii.AAC.1
MLAGLNPSAQQTTSPRKCAVRATRCQIDARPSLSTGGEGTWLRADLTARCSDGADARRAGLPWLQRRRRA